jgi:hypothetical protein
MLSLTRMNLDFIRVMRLRLVLLLLLVLLPFPAVPYSLHHDLEHLSWLEIVSLVVQDHKQGGQRKVVRSDGDVFGSR